MWSVAFIQLAGQAASQTAGQPVFFLSILCGQNINIRHYLQTFHLHCFIPIMLVGTIDLYHLISLSMYENWLGLEQFKLNILMQLLRKA